jgi:pyridoxamine 5'-phosphate oxidase
MDSPEFVLSSLDVAPSNSDSPTTYLPRARYCIFRGMWAELPENSHNSADKNPRVYESDLPTLTTDVRMEKVGQFFSTSAGKAESDYQVQGSGGGGPVEAVWWIKDEGVQWRVKGSAFVVSTDMEEDNEGQGRSGVKTVKSKVGAFMRVADGMEGKEGEWSWSREVTGHFGNLSPGMRG